MGASGAGKTTLLSALAQRNNGGLVLEGDVRLNGQFIGSKIRKKSAFLHQHDLFTPLLTVYEHLVFYARLKLDRRTPKAEIIEIVLDTLRSVGLQNMANRKIGTTGDNFEINLSGGERRRLSFATELLSKPDLFFCDEVTSGLDSYSTLHLITTMKKMTKHHKKTIICAIHQPSSDILEIFDDVIIMAESRTAFIGNSNAAVEFLSKQGYECPRNYNPADYFIKILAVTSGDEANSKKRIKNICDTYLISDRAKLIDNIIDDEIEKAKHVEINVTDDIKPTTWLTRLLLVTHRQQLDIYRNRGFLVFRLIQKVMIALLYGLIFAGTLTKDQKGIQALQGLFYGLAIQNVYAPVYSCLNKFQKQAPLFLRDYESGLVSVLQFYTSIIVSWLPVMVFESILLTIISYCVAGAYTSFNIFIDTLYLLVLTSLVSMICGMAFAAAIESFDISNFVLNEFLMLTDLSAGIFLSLRTIPIFLKPFEIVSWTRSIIELLYIVNIDEASRFSCPNNTDIDFPCLETGEQILDHYGYLPSNYDRDVISMFILMTVFYVFGYVFFLRRVIKMTTV